MCIKKLRTHQILGLVHILYFRMVDVVYVYTNHVMICNDLHDPEIIPLYHPRKDLHHYIFNWSHGPCCDEV